MAIKTRTEASAARWTWEDPDNDPEDVQLVLPVLQYAVESFHSADPSFTKSYAQVLARLRRIDPTIPPVEVMAMATHYVSCADYGYAKCIDELHWALVFAPWRSQDHMDRYMRAVMNGLGGPGPEREFYLPVASLELGLIKMPDFYEDAERTGRARHPLESDVRRPEQQGGM